MSDLLKSRSGIVIERRCTELDYDAGVAFIIDALDSERGAYFSSGVEDPTRYSRYDFGFLEPPLEFISFGRDLTVNALNQRGERLLAVLQPLLTGDPAVQVSEQDPRRLVLHVPRTEAVFAEEDRSHQPSVFTPIRRIIEDFTGIDDDFLGLYGAFGYDLIFQFEAMALSQDRGAVTKDMHLFLPDQIQLLDRRKEMVLRYDFEFSRGDLTTKGADGAIYAPMPAPVFESGEGSGTVVSDHTPEAYMANVDASRKRMHAGDIFEVVLSQKFSGEYAGAPSALYHLIRRINPSPYEFLMQFGDEQLVGASPEMFVRIEGDRVESSPISGTVRRGANAMEDAERIRELYNSDKDEVELTMCTDVDRNDKSRICRPGTIRLLERRMIERYAGLFHTVDHVEGRLREGFTGLDAFLSHMWAVTLTGAPKPMAVRLIEAMESSPREWYGGAIGTLLLNGNVNTGITIRTVHLRGNGAYYRAGATLVWDSDPAEENRECEVKATSFFRALASLAKPDAAAPPPAPLEDFSHLRMVVVDNEDSFVHTLADYFRQTGAEVKTYRAGVSIDRLLADDPHLVMHSPGPGTPGDFQVPALVRELAARGVPQFGVCLGLQGIVEAFGGELSVLSEPRHGKTWDVMHDGTGIFEDIALPVRVGAYHSLVAVPEKMPAELEVIATTEAGLVMAVRHRDKPIAAVQFHPESILSMHEEAGHRIVRNVLRVLTATT